MSEEYIALGDCIHGGIYRIHASNFTIGVFDATLSGFVGIRDKFGKEYLFVEYHWDMDAPFGTAQPYQLLEICPIADLSEGRHINGQYFSNIVLINYLEVVIARVGEQA